jgi:hypothetical protein
MLEYIDLSFATFATILRVITAILFANTTYMIEYDSLNLQAASHDQMKQLAILNLQPMAEIIEGCVRTAGDRW